MAGPKKISQEQYDKLRATLEERYGYEKMSDADKARFNETFDQTVVAETDDEENLREWVPDDEQ